MIKIWFKDRGQRPSNTETICEDAGKASTLPESFEVVGLEYGRRSGPETFDNRQFALKVEPPTDSISTEAVDAIATAFEDNWGGTIEHVETV